MLNKSERLIRSIAIAGGGLLVIAFSVKGILTNEPVRSGKSWMGESKFLHGEDAKTYLILFAILGLIGIVYGIALYFDRSAHDWNE